MIAKTSVKVACRTSYAVVKASGKDILVYLQGQITQDIKNISRCQALYAVVLSPQAKAVSDFYLLQTQDDEVMFLCPKAQAVALVERLRRFMLGYALRIGVVSSWQVWSVQGEDVNLFLAEKGLPLPADNKLAVQMNHHGYVLRMAEAASDGVWLIGEKSSVQANVDESEIDQGRILKGIPQFGVDWDEKVHPLQANLIERHGVNFEKGCYVGQEVTSRMHWRGGIKRKLYRVEVKGAVGILPCSIALHAAKVGSLTSMAVDDTGCQRGIAWLPIEIAISGQVLSVGQEGELVVLGVCE